MTGRRILRGGVVKRLAACLLAAAGIVLLAPDAGATPESDADGVITQAWEAAGGDTGSLGPKDGGVYAVGDGFGQKFAGGKIFFTPAAGAHVMQGAILEKYESLGGPADSDLGFPTIDEGAGRAPDSRNTTFSAADNPVIFWTPDTGARVVRGAINAAWDKLGGSGGALAVPAEDETWGGDVVTQKFTGGELSWNRQTKAFTTVPPDLAGQLDGLAIPEDATSAINAARRAAGGAMGPLGAKQGPQYAIGADGAGQDFAGGKIFYSPATGANVVTGQVLAKYEKVGGPSGDLGFPSSSEADGGLAPASRVTAFAAPDKPVIFWTPDYGAVVVRSAMNAAWAKLGGATGPLGAPTADQTESGNVVTQKFSGGEISWDQAKNKFSTQPANLASGLSGLQVPGYDPSKAPKGTPASNANGDKWFAWRSWYALIIVPVVLLLAALLAIVLVLRRRRRPATAAGDAGAVDPFAAPFANGHADAGPAAPLGYGKDDRYFAPVAPSSYTETVDGPTEDEPADERESADEPEPADEPLDDADTFDTEPIQLDEEPASGRHAAVQLDEPSMPAPTIHLPLDDPYRPPEGYPIKADIQSGRYWVPTSGRYHDAIAEIWFSSEEFARANGFVRAD
jgi:uncharacterized protein with LGFP repeats